MDPFNSPHNPPPASFSPSDHPFLAELVEKPSRPVLPWMAGALVILLIVGLVVGPLLYFALPAEITRWKIAAAEEKRLAGDLQGAIADLDQALAADPDDVQLLAKRMQWRTEQEDHAGALQDAQRLVQLRPRDINVVVQRSQSLQSLGRHAEAIADWKRILDMEASRDPRTRAGVLNGLAYARALGNVEIDEALVDIDEALRRVGENYEMIDTRGYLYYRKGDYERALQDLDRAVENAEEDYAAWLARSNRGGLGTLDPREQKLADRLRARHLAVVRYHRGLVYRAQGNADLAEQDFQRVKSLKCEPNDQLF